jgi:hypothetical protein
MNIDANFYGRYLRKIKTLHSSFMGEPAIKKTGREVRGRRVRTMSDQLYKNKGE